MKTVFNFILLAAGGLLATQAVARAELPPPAARLERDQATLALERLAALVDYVAADYPGAVKNGRVVVESELAEQAGMVLAAQELAARLGRLARRQGATADLERQLDALIVAVRAHAHEDTVVAACRLVHRLLIDDFGLVLAPLAPPSLDRARVVYAQACATCHGQDGRGDTEQAKKLKPLPLSFFDEERMQRISPALVFHALTFGVAGTAMASFDSLPASDRWSLAFYVVSFRHGAGDVGRGARRLAESKATLVQSASRLAGLSDAQLDSLLRASLPDAADRAAAIAFLRRDASFAPEPGGDFAVARRLLGQLADGAAGDRERLREWAIAAYLEGVEPHEAALRARDRDVAARVEQAFFDLRQAIDSGEPAEQIRREVARATLMLDGAEERDRGGASVPFFAALAIALREGFELSLLLVALLAFVRKRGSDARGVRDERWVHVGWMAAVPAGLATWFLVGAAVARGGARRELTEGVLTLVAAAMLLFVSHVVLGRLESRRWLRFLERRVAGAGGHPRAARAWLLALAAFIAAYREAIEIVLFFRALVLDAPGRSLAIGLGAAAGVVLLVALVRVMGALGRRLNPRPLLLASSVVLSLVAFSLVGQGVRALQEGGYLRLSPLAHVPSAPLFGLFPTREGVLAQTLVLLLALMPVWLERRRPARGQT